jgi:general secretion pathway protein G
MLQLQERDTRIAKPGFTLFEIIIVMVVIGGMMAFIVPQIFNYLKQSKVKSAKMELRGIQQAIVLYKSDTGKYPTKLRDLIKRPQDPAIRGKWSEGGYLGKEEEPVDPWDERYVYKPLQPGAKHAYELYSFGPNGRSAAKDERIDVWEL